MATRTFPPNPTALKAVRRFVLAELSDVDVDVVEPIILMVSELASNSIRHARSEFTVTIERAVNHVRATISDTGSGSPAIQPLSTTALSGRGLRIVNDSSDNWGIHRDHEFRNVVWFEINLDDNSPRSAISRSAEAARPRSPVDDASRLSQRGSGPEPLAGGESADSFLHLSTAVWMRPKIRHLVCGRAADARPSGCHGGRRQSPRSANAVRRGSPGPDNRLK